MSGVGLTLPGGIERNGIVYRDAVLEPLNGYLERTISEELDNTDNLPEAISNILTVAIQSIGGVKVDREAVASLCVADRQFIMMHMAQMIDGDQLWLRGCCSHCSEYFDVSINRSELPVRSAGDSFPVTTLECQGYSISVRIPNGEDQTRIACLEDKEALQVLLRRCLLRIEPEMSVETFVNKLSENDIGKIDTALEQASPAVCTSIITHCPECHAQQRLNLDPYGVEVLEAEGLYLQVHTLAYNYHWSESEILAMPRNRRHRYLHYIDTARGIYS